MHCQSSGIQHPLPLPLPFSLSPCLTPYRWGRQRQGSRGKSLLSAPKLLPGNMHACVYTVCLFCSNQSLMFYQPSACISIWTFNILSACVAILKWVPEHAIFVSWINSAALCVMDVRNHGCCHGDATLQYSFAARPPANACSTSKLGKTTEKGVEGKGDKRRGVCSRIHQNANHPLSTVCPSLCRR